MAFLGALAETADRGRPGCAVGPSEQAYAWVRAGALDDLAPTGRGVVHVDGVDLVVICGPRGKVFVFEDSCPHGRAKLSDGLVARRSLTCRAHGRKFRLADGQCLSRRGSSLARVPFVVEAGDLYVGLAASADPASACTN